MNMTGIWAGIIVFAGGSYALRSGGVLLRARVVLSAGVEKAIDRAVVILLLAVVSTSTVFAGPEFAGYSRLIGVAVGGVCAWFRAPVVVVVLVAAATASILRLSGLS